MTPRICKIARKSVVIIADKKDEDAYCSGCVLLKVVKDDAVTVIVSSEFVKGRKGHLKVVFFDRKELNATWIAEQGPFCCLRTKFHSECEAVSLLTDEGALKPSTTFMFAPISHNVNQKMSTFCTLESVASYRGRDETELIVDSTKYFLVSCPYVEKTSSGINRLTAAPVFTVHGRTAGIVLQNCRDVDEEPAAAEIKVVLKASYLHELKKLLSQASPKRRVNKRKRV